jgi:molybdate transport system substrate-binding protein
MKKQLLSLFTVAALAVTLAGCGSSSPSGSSTPKATVQRTLTVLAASSLTETFTELAKTFESQHKGVTVKLVFDSSATLAGMAEQGAPGDVLATADQKTMEEANSKNGIGSTPQQFATNVVMLAVPSANPAGISSFGDLQKSSVKYVVCVPTAPCGAAAAALLKSNKITHKPVSEEVDVKSVLAKVVASDADAGMVYRTDVTAAGGKVKGIAVPGAAESPNTYWVATTSNAQQKQLAKDWITLMGSTSGMKVLMDAGFGMP